MTEGGNTPLPSRLHSRASEPPSASPAPSALPPVRLPATFTLAGLTDAWPELVSNAREQSRFLGEALATARLVAVDPPVVTLAPEEGNPIHAESLERQLSAVEGMVSRLVGGEARVQLAGGAPEPVLPRAKRLSEGQARAERLRVLRAKDPTLEAAAEGLDLEPLE